MTPPEQRQDVHQVRCVSCKALPRVIFGALGALSQVRSARWVVLLITAGQEPVAAAAVLLALLPIHVHAGTVDVLWLGVPLAVLWTARQGTARAGRG